MLKDAGFYRQMLLDPTGKILLTVSNLDEKCRRCTAEMAVQSAENQSSALVNAKAEVQKHFPKLKDELQRVYRRRAGTVDSKGDELVGLTDTERQAIGDFEQVCFHWLPRTDLVH